VKRGQVNWIIIMLTVGTVHQ